MTKTTHFWDKIREITYFRNKITIILDLNMNLELNLERLYMPVYA